MLGTFVIFSDSSQARLLKQISTLTMNRKLSFHGLGSHLSPAELLSIIINVLQVVLGKFAREVAWVR
jgi:hypothetical protein